MSGFFFSSFEKYNIEDIDFRYLPVVCLDIGHNETAINRVAQQFKIDCQEKNIRVVCSLSKTRNLSIFQPLLLHFTHTFCESKVVKEIPENRLNGIHYLDIEHPRTLTFKQISEQLNEEHSNELILKPSECVHKAIKLSEKQLEEKLKQQLVWKRKKNITLTSEDKIAFLLLECFVEQSNLLFIGSSFLMKPVLQFLQWI